METRKIINWVFISLLLLAISSLAVMLLWNLLLPDIFGFIKINYWQALGIFVLARILFFGFGGRKTLFGRIFHRHHNPMHEKWKSMTPEQRQEYINRRRQFGNREFSERNGRHYCNKDEDKELEAEK